MTMIDTLLTAMVVAREWERGTMEALMSTPVQIQEIILGKLLPYFGLGLGLARYFCSPPAFGGFSEFYARLFCSVAGAAPRADR